MRATTLFMILAMLSVSFSCKKSNTNCVGELVKIDSNFPETGFYKINSVKIDGDCLNMNVSHNGCTTIEPSERFDLYGQTDFNTAKVKLKLVTGTIELACNLMATSNISFSLLPLRGNLAKGSFTINLEGWSQPITYSF